MSLRCKNKRKGAILCLILCLEYVVTNNNFVDMCSFKILVDGLGISFE